MENPEGKTLRQVLEEIKEQEPMEPGDSPLPQRLTPTGLPMVDDDESDDDLRRRIKTEKADQRPVGKTTFKSFVDQTAGMRETNRRGRIRSKG